MPPKSEERPDVQVFTEIGFIEHYVQMSVVKHLPAGMSYAQFELLTYFMREGDGQTPAEIAEAVLRSKAAITNTLQRMQGQGYVAVLSDVKDRRKKRVRLTRAGVEAYREVVKAMRGKTEVLRDGFTEAEFRQVLPFLKALRTFLEETKSLDAPAAALR